MAYLNTTSTDFFSVDLDSGKFKLYKNQGVVNYVDYEADGEFLGKGALRFESFSYPSTPQRIFRILASFVYLPLKISDVALKLSQPNEWSGKEVRAKVLVRGESGSDGYIFIDLGGYISNEIHFVIGRNSNQIMTYIQLSLGGSPSAWTPPIFFGLNSWYLVDFQAKMNFSANQLTLRNVVYPVILNADGTFNNLGTPIGVQTVNIGSPPSPSTLWGVDPIEVQGFDGNPVGIWLDNLSIGQGEEITEL